MPPESEKRLFGLSEGQVADLQRESVSIWGHKLGLNVLFILICPQICPHIYLKLAFPTVANRQQKTP
jgi:hypothetical protein